MDVQYALASQERGSGVGTAGLPRCVAVGAVQTVVSRVGTALVTTLRAHHHHRHLGRDEQARPGRAFLAVTQALATAAAGGQGGGRVNNGFGHEAGRVRENKDVFSMRAAPRRCKPVCTYSSSNEKAAASAAALQRQVELPADARERAAGGLALLLLAQGLHCCFLLGSGLPAHARDEDGVSAGGLALLGLGHAGHGGLLVVVVEKRAMSRSLRIGTKYTTPTGGNPKKRTPASGDAGVLKTRLELA